MYYFKVRNFEQFQHYKHRNPPWIRLYYKLLHDRQFFRLKDTEKYTVIGCFLLASQHGNKIPFDPEWIIKELSLSGCPDWEAIINSEFIIPIDCDASALKACCAPYTDNSDSSDNTETDSSEAEILSFSAKRSERAETRKNQLYGCSEIFKFWNAQTGLMSHRSIDAHEKAIVQTLRKYSPEEIKLAIERYAIVRRNEHGKYRSLYQWTLAEFLTRQSHYNLERFAVEDWEQPFMSSSVQNCQKSTQSTDKSWLTFDEGES